MVALTERVKNFRMSTVARYNAGEVPVATMKTIMDRCTQLMRKAGKREEYLKERKYTIERTDRRIQWIKNVIENKGVITSIVIAWKDEDEKEFNVFMATSYDTATGTIAKVSYGYEAPNVDVPCESIADLKTKMNSVVVSSDIVLFPDYKQIMMASYKNKFERRYVDVSLMRHRWFKFMKPKTKLWLSIRECADYYGLPQMVKSDLILQLALKMVEDPEPSQLFYTEP